MGLKVDFVNWNRIRVEVGLWELNSDFWIPMSFGSCAGQPMKPQRKSDSVFGDLIDFLSGYGFEEFRLGMGLRNSGRVKFRLT